MRQLVMLIAVASALFGCRDAPAQLIVVVDSDIPPAELGCVGVTATDPDAELGDSRRVRVGLGDGLVRLPFSVGVLPPGGDASRSVRVEVRAYGPGIEPCPADSDPDGSPVLVARVAQTGFRAGARLRLPMFLADGCRALWRDCEMRGQTCAADCEGDRCSPAECRSTTVPPESLREVEPGTELDDAGARIDAGSGDAGTDDAGTTPDAGGPVDAGPVPPSRRLSAGVTHTCALGVDARLTCWGSNAFGALGDGTGMDRLVPVAVAGLTDAVSVHAGNQAACATDSLGRAWCWGRNGEGQLGIGSTSNRNAPTGVLTTIADVVEGVVGQDHSCFRMGTGAVHCTGANDTGQLGDGNAPTGRTMPGPVMGLTDAVDIDAQTNHVCAATRLGTVSCWGSNGGSQLGNGSTANSDVPVGPPGLIDAVAVTVGAAHTCALRAGGIVACWGDNRAGQLGDGTTNDRNAPAPVPGLVATAVAAGTSHTCARTDDARVLCWGDNVEGQLGDGTTRARSLPTVVGLGGVGATDVTAGSRHSCAPLADGSARCWGDNARGQLGDGTMTSSLVPVAVSP